MGAFQTSFRHHLSREIPEILPRAHCGRFILSVPGLPSSLDAFSQISPETPESLAKNQWGPDHDAACLTGPLQAVGALDAA